MSAPRFSNETLRFLRGLKRHNEREWFAAHRADYETHVRDRMHALIDHLASDLTGFAPELVASPKVSLYRIHRDTRFSADKSPYKTQVAAIFPHRQLSRHGGAGLYFHISPDHVLVAAGLYAPEPPQLYRVRHHLAANYRRFRSIIESPLFTRSFGAIEGRRLKRPPKGFAADHPAIDYLKLKQFLASTERPPTFATGPRFYGSLVRLFSELAPFVRFLNEPLTQRDEQTRIDPLMQRRRQPSRTAATARARAERRLRAPDS